MAIVAAAVRTGFDWGSDKRFKVRLDITSPSSENSVSGVLTAETFSVADPESVVNAGIHSYVLNYVTEQWGMVIDPAVDTIEIINPYDKAPPPLALNNDKLLAYWKLDEDTGAAEHLVDSHASFDLTNNGGVTFESGQVGDAARFQGTQSLSRAYAAALNPTDALTFSCWAKLPTGFGGHAIAGTWQFGTNVGWALIMDASGCFVVYVAADALDTTGSNFATTTTGGWDDDAWHHVLIRIDTTQPVDTDRVTISVDEVNEALTFTGTIPAAIMDDGGAFTIGDWPGNFAANGLIDECEYRDGGGALIASWKFDGIPRADSVGSNHLTEVGTVTREATPDGSFAAVFDRFVGGYLAIDDSPDLVSGDFDFTVTLMAKYDPAYTDVDICLFSSRDVVGVVTVFSLWKNAGGQIVLNTPEGVYLTTFYLDPNGYGGIWGFFRFWYDSTANTWNFQMDAQPIASLPEIAAPAVGSTRVEIGANDGVDVFNGAIRRVAYFKRVLTDEEWAIIYNDGAGQDYPFEEVNLPLTQVRNTSYCRMDVDHAISDTTKTRIPRMVFPLEPYVNYSISLTLYTTSNDEAVGVQFKLGNVGAVLNAARLVFEGPGSPTTLLWIDDTSAPFTFDPGVSQGNVIGVVKITGTIEVGDTGGTLELWHGSSDASLTTVLRGSWGMCAKH